MLPLLPDREGSVREERRLVDEARKILQDEGLMISASVVQSRSSTATRRWSVLKPCARWRQRKRATRLAAVKISSFLKRASSRPVGDATGSAHLSVGCVRNDYGMPEQVQFWSVADNVRFGGALMAVKIAEAGAGVSVLMSEVDQKPVHKIALGIEYDGSKYYGWQRQNEVRSVQEKLEKALSQVANEPINVLCAGRTDAVFMARGRWFTLKPPPCVRMPHGRWV